MDRKFGPFNASISFLGTERGGLRRGSFAKAVGPRKGGNRGDEVVRADGSGGSASTAANGPTCWPLSFLGESRSEVRTGGAGCSASTGCGSGGGAFGGATLAPFFLRVIGNDYDCSDPNIDHFDAATLGSFFLSNLKREEIGPDWVGTGRDVVTLQKE